MKPKKKIWYIVLFAVNIAVIVLAAAITFVGNSISKEQSYNFSAQKWDNSKKLSFSQVSCFLSEDSGFNTDNVGELRNAEINSLEKVSVKKEEGKTLVPDAYSADVGSYKVRGDISGKSEAYVTAVGGNFFLFRDFSLIDGAYFSEDDLMQDGAVITRSLAWQLYGSENISGMNMYINDVKFYICGVIDDPKEKYQKKSAGDVPRAYISYDAASNHSIYSGGDFNSDKFKKITCYECIMPDPVENYAVNTIKDFFKESYKGKYSVVDNTKRFDPKRRANAYKNIEKYVIRDNSVIYPWWENASRMADFRLTRLYHLRKIILILPIITLVLLISAGYVLFRRKTTGCFAAAADKVNTYFYNKKVEKAQQAKESINNNKEK